ncbi:actin-1-like [Ambystoma mexicanum]|uniref:actin-1-like n=1 Tax=Ambystoma mexicanum TaxID=8296 RepID=UPI0037E8AA96
MESPTVVIDNGSGFCRSGFAGSDQPKSIIKTIAAIPILQGKKQDNLCLLSDSYSSTMGMAIDKRRPISHGIITDWEAMEILWNHIFVCKLKVFPEDQPVLMTDSPSSPSTNREKMAEVLFEAFAVPGLQIANTALLTLCSYGLISGLVIEAGAGVSYTAVVCEGEVLKQATYRLDIAGRSLTKHLTKLLLEANNFPLNLEKKVVTRIKQTCCYVSLDFEKDVNSNKQELANFDLPDGQHLTLGRERFTCPEPFFRPQMLGHDSPGIHLLAMSSIQKVPAEFRAEVVGHIVFSGGSSMFPGFPERIRHELLKISPEDYHYRFLASPERSEATWAGGSIIASLQSSKPMMMTMKDYQEYGAFHVYEKFG